MTRRLSQSRTSWTSGGRHRTIGATDLGVATPRGKPRPASWPSLLTLLPIVRPAGQSSSLTGASPRTCSALSSARSGQSLDPRHIPRSNPEDGMGLLAGTTNQDEEVRTFGPGVGVDEILGPFSLRAV